MAQLIRIGQDGFDADRIVRWNDNTANNTLSIWLDGAASPFQVALTSLAAKSLLAWLEANSTDGKSVPAASAAGSPK